MSDNKFNTTEELNEELRREYQAYEELRMIVAIAIETGNFASLEPNIAIWENKYQIGDFIDAEIVRKIKAILNQDYLSRLVGDYLASQILHEQEKQQAAYNDLKAIINKAKKTKNYKAAEKDIAAWKASLSDRGLSMYSFNKAYTRQIFKMLLFPSRELAIEQEASKSLKQIVNDSKNMDSSELEKEIALWKNKYSLDTFPDKLEEELNSMTADGFKSITIKKSEEAAISELTSFISSDKMSSPAEEIPVLLSKYDYLSFSDAAKSQIDDLTTSAMSLVELNLDSLKPIVEEDSINPYIPPTQQEALYDLKDVFSKSSQDMEAIFNWIYLYRTIDFVPEARDEIKTMFRMAGFSKPAEGEYSIPSLDAKMEDLKPKDINEIREKVILNYLGIIYSNSRSLSSIDQGNISTIRNKQEVMHAVIDTSKTQATIVLPALDNEPDKLDITTNTLEPDATNIKESTFEDVEDENVTASEIIAPAVLKEDDTDDITSASAAVNQIEDSVSADVVYENPEEVNILIEDLLQDPVESIDLSSKDKKKKETKKKDDDEISTTGDKEPNIETNIKPIENQEEPITDEAIDQDIITDEAANTADAADDDKV